MQWRDIIFTQDYDPPITFTDKLQPDGTAHNLHQMRITWQASSLGAMNHILCPLCKHEFCTTNSLLGRVLVCGGNKVSIYPPLNWLLGLMYFIRQAKCLPPEEINFIMAQIKMLRESSIAYKANGF